MKAIPETAQINVNQHNHLISLLSMIGPSPDWCIGKCFTMLGGASVYCLNVGSLNPIMAVFSPQYVFYHSENKNNIYDQRKCSTFFICLTVLRYLYCPK
jgi:hypothetical protein